MTDQYVDEDFGDDYPDGIDEAYVDELDELDGPDGNGAARHAIGPVDEVPGAASRRSPRSTELEGRTSWYYLGLLSGLFVLLVFFAWACDDRSTEPPLVAETATEEVPLVAEAARLVVDVDGDVITLRGAVPDEAARQQLVTVARDRYGSENVVDELVVDPGVTLDGGSVSINGSAAADDERPEALRQAIAADFGIEVAELRVDRGDGVLGPVDVSVLVDGPSVRLVGGVPDQASIEDLTAAAVAVWGESNVDGSGLEVADATWTDGVVRVTGTAAVGDTRAEGFPAEVEQRFGALVTVDTSGVTVDEDPAALTTIEEQINAQLADQPIRFEPLSADIVPESDAVLGDIAAALGEIPTVAVEVVGHTDSLGDEEENLTLSQQRAEAVIARLVELGVAEERLTAQGEGEASPIADNSTDEGREQNRRIEFRLATG